jgi:hypothetical protein
MLFFSLALAYSGWFLPIQVYSTMDSSRVHQGCAPPQLPLGFGIGTDSIATDGVEYMIIDYTSGDTIFLDCPSPPPPGGHAVWWSISDSLFTLSSRFWADIRSDSSDTLHFKMIYQTTYGIADSYWVEWDTSLIPSGGVFEITSSIVDALRGYGNEIDWSEAIDMREYSKTSSIAFYEIAYIRVRRTTGIGEAYDADKPAALALTAYPNPFNSAVAISAPASAVIEIFDLNGRSVAKLPGGEQIWTPEPTEGSGVYLVRAVSPDGTFSDTKRVVYLK